MPQYFDNDKNVVSKEREVEFDFLGHQLRFLSDHGVFSRNQVDEGTRLLLETACSFPPTGRILDMGSGYGVIGLTILALFPETRATLADVNRRALELARKNADSLGVGERAEIVESDVYLGIDGKYDLIVSNPPIRAGKAVTYRIYEGAKEHLTDGGSLCVVIRRKQGAESARKYIESLFPNVTVANRSRGYHVILAKTTTK